MGKYRLINTIIIVILVFTSCKREQNESVYQGRVIRETLALHGEEYTELFYDDVENVELYQLLPNREKLIMIEGVDYVIAGNKIKRTSHSVIPDFANHQVKYEPDGRFIWTPEPDRNPELMLNYQLYADYKYDNRYEQPIKARISEELNNKLTSGKSLKIVCNGTSISFSAHTYENYYYNNDSQSYLQLIARSIRKIYGVESTVLNLSTDGGGVNQIQDLQPIVDANPDVVILELGMNDHNGVAPNSDYYTRSIEYAIDVFKANSIDVVLIGFFQQNPQWSLEYPANTKKYNDILSQLAQKYHLFFADIYSAFERIDKRKLYRDYMGDFMHHPTSFGHKLYYLEVMPFFINTSMLKEIYWNIFNRLLPL